MMKETNIKKKYFRYVSQSVAGTVGVSCYILADTFFISVAGGADGITVLNLVIPVFCSIFALSNMFGVGAAVCFALDKAQGKKDAPRHFEQALTVQLLISIPFVLSGIFLPGTILKLLGGDAQIVSLGIPYIKIVLLMAPFFLTHSSFTAFARNDGAPGLAMTDAVLSSLFNIVADYVFMFPLGMGLKGAALATGVSPLIGILICLPHYLGKRSVLRIRLRLPKLSLLFREAALGFSAFIAELASGITTTVYNFLILSLSGNVGVAAYGILANLAIVFQAIFSGIAQGAQPLLSEAYGVKREKEEREIVSLSLLTSAVSACFLVLLTWILAPEFVNVFNSEKNAALADLAVPGLRLYSLGFLLSSFNLFFCTWFSATEKPAFALAASLARGVVFITVFAMVLAWLFGMNGIWLSFPAAEAASLVLVFLLIKSGRNKR